MRLLRFIIGLLLLPFAGALTRTVFRILCGLHAVSSAVPTGAIALLSGVAVWMLVWIFLPPATRTYVLGHELTHALWGLLFGARASDLHVSEGGGSVRVSKSNVWITLAPYFFPFYTILVILAYAITSCFAKPVPWPWAWLFAVGFTWAFHLVFTIQSLLIRQPDVMEYGRLFSYVFIYSLNLLGIGIWIVCTTDATFIMLAREIGSSTLLCYGESFRFIGWCFDSLAALLGKMGN